MNHYYMTVFYILYWYILIFSHHALQLSPNVSLCNFSAILEVKSSSGSYCCLISPSSHIFYVLKLQKEVINWREVGLFSHYQLSVCVWDTFVIKWHALESQWILSPIALTADLSLFLSSPLWHLIRQLWSTAESRWLLFMYTNQFSYEWIKVSWNFDGKFSFY